MLFPVCDGSFSCHDVFLSVQHWWSNCLSSKMKLFQFDQDIFKILQIYQNQSSQRYAFTIKTLFIIGGTFLLLCSSIAFSLFAAETTEQIAFSFFISLAMLACILQLVEAIRTFPMISKLIKKFEHFIEKRKLRAVGIFPNTSFHVFWFRINESNSKDHVHRFMRKNQFIGKVAWIFDHQVDNTKFWCARGTHNGHQLLRVQFGQTIVLFTTLGDVRFHT